MRFLKTLIKYYIPIILVTLLLLLLSIIGLMGPLAGKINVLKEQIRHCFVLLPEPAVLGRRFLLRGKRCCAAKIFYDAVDIKRFNPLRRLNLTERLKKAKQKIVNELRDSE